LADRKAESPVSAGQPGEFTLRTWAGGRSRQFLAVASAAAAVFVVAGVVAADTLTVSPQSHNLSSRSGPPAQVVSVKSPFKVMANVTPPVAASTCRTPTLFTYSGTLSATAPGTVKYRWVYSSGKPGPAHTVRFTAAGHKVVAGATVKPMTSGGGWGEIKMISPVAQTSKMATYKLLCGRGSTSGITATAAVEPASRTVSCATAPPTLAATGLITTSKAETVTYYWAVSDGANSSPATLTFTKPGTQPVEPLTISPPAASGSGNVVLVVTSPVTAASRPATYTLTCTAAATSPTAAVGNPPPTTSPGSGGITAPPLPPDLVVTVDAPTAAYPGLPYSGTVTVTGGEAPYNWSAASGLPSGMTATANGATLTISGTPAFVGTYAAYGSVTDSYSLQQIAYWEIDITAIYAPITFSCPAGQATDGQPYAGTLTATGGNGTAFTWSEIVGLPPGLTGILNGDTYTISGTPEVSLAGSSANYYLSVTVSDSQTSFGTTCTIVVSP
jgi:hypothetical protein